MEDKLHWMYGFWIVLSGVKSVQSFLRLAACRREHGSIAIDQWLLAAFWSVAVLFYAYMIWRKAHPRPRTHDRRRPVVAPTHGVS